MHRVHLHAEAESIFRQLVAAWGVRLPEDVRTVLGYYQSCRVGLDRAAEHVLLVRGRLP